MGEVLESTGSWRGRNSETCIALCVCTCKCENEVLIEEGFQQARRKCMDKESELFCCDHPFGGRYRRDSEIINMSIKMDVGKMCQLIGFVCSGFLR